MPSSWEPEEVVEVVTTAGDDDEASVVVTFAGPPADNGVWALNEMARVVAAVVKV